MSFSESKKINQMTDKEVFKAIEKCKENGDTQSDHYKRLLKRAGIRKE